MARVGASRCTLLWPRTLMLPPSFEASCATPAHEASIRVALQRALWVPTWRPLSNGRLEGLRPGVHRRPVDPLGHMARHLDDCAVVGLGRRRRQRPRFLAWPRPRLCRSFPERRKRLVHGFGLAHKELLPQVLHGKLGRGHVDRGFGLSTQNFSRSCLAILANNDIGTVTGSAV